MKTEHGTRLPANRKFRTDIQGLRALAVVLVVLCHAELPGFSGGYVGVDVFFVISGFVITQVLESRREASLRQHLAQFYSRRIRRIIPASTVVLISTAIATYAWLGPSTGAILITDIRWASLFAANWHLIATSSSYFIPGVPPSLVTHFWSLAVEEQFYFGYPILVFSLALFVGVRRRIPVLIVILILAITASSWCSIHLTPLNGTLAYYSPVTRFWELALGGVIALLPKTWFQRTLRMNTLLATAALGAIIAAATSLNSYSQYPGSLAWWPCGATAVLLFTGRVPLRGGPPSWLSWRPVRYVGDVSYGFYLWHYVWLMLPQQHATTPLSAITRVGLIFGAFGCAVLSFHFVEDPIRRSKWLDEHSWASGVLLLCCLALTWIVTLIYTTL